MDHSPNRVPIRLNHKSEILRLDQPFSPAFSLGSIGRRIRDQNEGLAEPTLREIPRLSESHKTAGNHQNREILRSCLLGRLHSGGRRGRIGLVDDLAVKGLYFVVRWRHLIDKDLLDCATVGDDVSIENDRRSRLTVERGYRGTVGLERGIERLNEFSGRWRLRTALEKGMKEYVPV